MFLTFSRRLWYLLLTMKPLNHISGAIPVIAGIAFNWFQKDIATTQLLIYFLVFLTFYSALYQMNELYDYKKDVADPIRRYRPLASGKISKKAVAISAAILGTFTSIILVIYKPVLSLVLLFLFALNYMYVTYLKQFPYIDFPVISFTFVGKFFSGLLLCSSGTIPIVAYVVALFFYSIIATLHCIKKIGRLLQFSDTATILKGTTLRRMKYGFLSLGFLILLFTESPLHAFLWVYFLLFVVFAVLLDVNKRIRLSFYSYQRWYSTT